jgi:hypothetical protein
VECLRLDVIADSLEDDRRALLGAYEASLLQFAGLTVAFAGALLAELAILAQSTSTGWTVFVVRGLLLPTLFIMSLLTDDYLVQRPAITTILLNPPPTAREFYAEIRAYKENFANKWLGAEIPEAEFSNSLGALDNYYTCKVRIANKKYHLLARLSWCGVEWALLVAGILFDVSILFEDAILLHLH